jgi:hypothetical protein
MLPSLLAWVRNMEYDIVGEGIRPAVPAGGTFDPEREHACAIPIERPSCCSQGLAGDRLVNGDIPNGDAGAVELEGHEVGSPDVRE